MIIELITVTSTELNTAARVSKSVTDLTISGSPVSSSETTVKKHLTINSLSVNNTTGATIHFVPLTELESNIYTNTPTITDLIPVPDSTEKTLSDMKGEINTIICSGVSGHSADLTFVLYKD